MAAFKSPSISNSSPAVVAPEQFHKDTRIVGKLVLALAVLLVLSGGAFVIFGGAQNGATVSSVTRGEVASLLTVADFSEFDRRLDAKIAEAGKNGIDRAYLVALVDRINDPTSVETVLPKNTYVSSQAPANLAEGSRILHHDVNMVGGRATYAINRLTGKTVPTVKASDDLARMAQVKNQVREIVLKD
ncbi:MAG TPA: hypothetical protein VL860_07095 [Planctomycetota bacterium]|nr:hypothetical protein [Planctomycetota bacterium]